MARRFSEARSATMKARWADPEIRERVLAKRRATLATAEHRTKRSEIMKAAWADPEKRQRMAEGSRAVWTPEKRARARVKSLSIDCRANVSVGVRAAMARPAVRQKNKAARERNLTDPVIRAKIVAGLMSNHNDPDLAAVRKSRQREAMQRDDTRANLRAGARQRGLRVPRWVISAELVDEYLDQAEAFGEERAASHCRELRKSMPAIQTEAAPRVDEGDHIVRLRDQQHLTFSIIGERLSLTPSQAWHRYSKRKSASAVLA
jgi:hypothetical protein